MLNRLTQASLAVKAQMYHADPVNCFHSLQKFEGKFGPSFVRWALLATNRSATLLKASRSNGYADAAGLRQSHAPASVPPATTFIRVF